MGRYRWLTLPEGYGPGWKEALLAAVVFGSVLFLGLVLP